jgi:glycosyltransferase involved in cell wall biosynthesis
MKIAIQNPMYSGAAGKIGINKWVLNFIRQFKPIIYISDFKHIPSLVFFLYKAKINPIKYQIIFSIKKLSSKADVLVCFNGRPYLEQNFPPKQFTGMKIWHILDCIYFPAKSYKILLDTKVDFLFGYSKHDIYSNFFMEKYPFFIGRVIPVPFGFGNRFIVKKDFRERKNKVIALGSVNSFDDPVHNIDDFAESNNFFIKRGEKFMHKFRRMLLENEKKLENIMDNKLPHYPQVKDFSYDIVETLNDYTMCTSCESLLYFPAAKAFEGPASGSVLVCSDHPCFSDYGFEDGVNCIKHKQFDINDFREKVSYYINNPNKLRKIQKEGTNFVRENYNHSKVATYVYEQIKEKYQSRQEVN